MENTGWAAEVQNWTAIEKEVLRSAWRESTLKTYRPAWNSWRQWSLVNNVNTVRPTPGDLARYLIFLYNVKKLSPKTILVHKSTVATFIKPSDYDFLSNHPLVKKTIKAITSKSPPKNKATTWSVSELMEWLSKQIIDESNLFQVSQHVATLLLLASGRRIHDLTLLHITRDQLEVSQDQITLWPSFGSKTDSSSFRQSGWVLSKSDDKQFNLCHWIPLLIKVSSQRRQANPALTNLFITTRGKVKGASRTVISGWLRLLFARAKIKNSPGSFRSAVATDNWINKHMDIDDVLQKGNWRNAKTFLKYYYKQVDSVVSKPSRAMSNLFSTI